MRHASLFSGIGGFDLAAEWAGWTNVFNCEIEDFPRRVLKYHFPNAIQYGNIKETDFTIHRGRIDVLTGGFPCQPFSVAGKRLGKNDERHLWPEMYRAIQQIKPKWIVGENVRGLLSWSDGLVLDEVYTDLENEGYEVQSFVLPAAGINAPHKRERVWIVAKNTMRGGFVHGESIQEGTEIREQWDSGSGSINGIHREEGNYASNTDSGGRDEGDQCQHYRSSEWEVRKGESDNGNGVWCFTRTGGGNGSSSDTNNEGLQGGEINGSINGIWEEREEQFTRYISSAWEDFPTQSPVCGGNDGIPDQLDDIAVPKWRRESIKAYGNAIVPQIAYRIFETINIMEEW
jgi:DNA (cytosine-5)-methyltransferase 1